MQETGLFVFLSIIGALVSLVGAWFVARQVVQLEALRRTVRQALDEQIALSDRIEVAITGVKRIEGRIVKGQQRSAAKVDPDAEPDSKIDPEGWKLWKNRQLATASRGRMQ